MARYELNEPEARDCIACAREALERLTGKPRRVGGRWPVCERCSTLSRPEGRKEG